MTSVPLSFERVQFASGHNRKRTVIQYCSVKMCARTRDLKLESLNIKQLEMVTPKVDDTEQFNFRNNHT